MSTPVPGQSLCYIKRVVGEKPVCVTHGLEFDTDEEVPAHIQEKLEEWRAAQTGEAFANKLVETLGKMGIHPVQPGEIPPEVKEEVDWEKLAKEDPQKFGAKLASEMMKSLGSRDSMTTWIGANLHLQLTDGDFVEIHFQASTLEGLVKRAREAREAVRSAL